MVRAHEPDCNIAVLPDDSIRFALGSIDVFPGRVVLQIDRRRFRAHMKADSAIVEEPIECGREDVLSGVLLHVIKSSRPIDLAAHLEAFRQRARQHVDNVIIKLEGVYDFDRRFPGSAPLTRLTRPTCLTRPIRPSRLTRPNQQSTCIEGLPA